MYAVSVRKPRTILCDEAVDKKEINLQRGGTEMCSHMLRKKRLKLVIWKSRSHN